MDSNTRARIEQGQRLARRIVPEHKPGQLFVQQTKTALRRVASEKGIGLAAGRVSLWREHQQREFEHLGRTRTIYLAFQQADTWEDEIFVFDSIGGEALTFIIRPPQEGD